MGDFFDDFDNGNTDNEFDSNGTDNLFGDFDDGSNDSGQGGMSDIGGANVGQGNSDINTKKVLIISIVVGIVGVCLAFFIWSHLRGGNESNTVNTTTNNVATDTTENVQSGRQDNSQNKVAGNQADTDVSVGADTNKGVSNEETKTGLTSGFVEVDSSTMPAVSDPISSYLTVIDIKTYAKKKDDKYGNYFKSIIYGNITGLDGVYELTVPFENVSKVHIGDVIDIKYTTVTVGDNKFVVDIR